MGLPNAKQDIQCILFFFSETFSRPSFKMFSSFIMGFIQLGKEVHTSSMVRSMAGSFFHRSLRDQRFPTPIVAAVTMRLRKRRMTISPAI